MLFQLLPKEEPLLHPSLHFGIPILRKALVRFRPAPFKFELHVFVEPFRLGGFLQLTGLVGDSRYEAVMKLKQKEAGPGSSGPR